MKLFHKIFLCFVVIFGITFQAAGYFLINYTYENAVEQQKKIAFQDFQYNRYILQLMLYSDPKFIYEGESKSILKNFTVPVLLNVNLEDGPTSNIEMLEINIAINQTMDTWISTQIYERENGNVIFQYDSYQEKGKDNLSYQIYERGGKSYIFVFGVVRQGGHELCLVTQTDISSVINSQKSMTAYFQRIYIVIICISFPVIFLLTKALTASLKKVSEGAGRIAQGNYSQRICTKGRDEIYELASGFNQMAGQVEEKIAELSDMIRQKEEFAANFAHELKTPMTSVIGYADMLYQRDLPREEVKNAAGYILEEGMRLETLSLKLMDLFVLDKQKFSMEWMSVEEMFENLEQGMEPMCRKYGAVLHLDIGRGGIWVDFDLFKTMILNLADNSVKAGCEDLWISGRQEGAVYRIEIKDNGRGIPPEELGKITEAFYMVDKSRSRKQHGAGLGMALVSKIAKIHEAKMKIESDGKTGTAVTLEFYQTERGRYGQKT